MNLSQRLRQLAASTGLDGFAHELRAIADEMEAQPADVTDEQILTEAARHLGEMHVEDCGLSDIKDFARAILALRPVQVPMTDKQAIEMNDAAFDKYMTQDARAIELVRSVEAHHGIKLKEQA